MSIATREFSPQQAFEYTCDIAKPRVVGSDREAQTARYIAEHMREFGYEVVPERFRFADTVSIFLVLEILISQILVILSVWMLVLGKPFQFVSAILLLIFLLSISSLNTKVREIALLPEEDDDGSRLRRMVRKAGKQFEAANIVGHLPGWEESTDRTHLTLVAHYDSKSQRIPLVLRIALFTLGMSCAVLCALCIFLAIILPALSTTAIVTGVMAVTMGIPLLLLDQGNLSPGAIDNASSVGVLLHLAEILAHPLTDKRKLNLTILFTSAEEVSVMGAMAYVHRHEHQVQAQAESGDYYVVNLDGVGVDGQLFWVGKDKPSGSGSQNIIDLIHQACCRLNLKIRPFNLAGALYDHMPFSQLGLEACTLVAINRKSAYIHTARDNIIQVDVRGLKQAGQVIVEVVELLIHRSNGKANARMPTV